MHIPKQYLHDKLVLLLASANVFLVFVGTVAILLKIGLGEGIETYIVGYRQSLGTIDPYLRGDIWDMVAFIFFMIIVAAFSLVLSIKTYTVRRSASLGIVSLSGLLLIISIIVSNALLVLY